MEKIPYIKLSGDALKFDRDELNKNVFYPVAEIGYNTAKAAAMAHLKTSELSKTLKTVSLAKRSTTQVGYVIMAGRRRDYTNNLPHFMLFNAYNNGIIRKQITRKVRAAISKLN